MYNLGFWLPCFLAKFLAGWFLAIFHYFSANYLTINYFGWQHRFSSPSVMPITVLNHQALSLNHYWRQSWSVVVSASVTASDAAPGNLCQCVNSLSLFRCVRERDGRQSLPAALIHAWNEGECALGLAKRKAVTRSSSLWVLCETKAALFSGRESCNVGSLTGIQSAQKIGTRDQSPMTRTIKQRKERENTRFNEAWQFASVLGARGENYY